MSRSKFISATTMIIFIFTIAMVNCALAGEKVKWHGTGVSTSYQQMEVGDEDGHVLAIYEAKQVFIDEKTGEKMVSISKGALDINPKAGQVTVKGYGVTTDPNGDQLIRKQEGKAIGKGHMKGTWTWIKATGKYKGYKGGGTWESWALTPTISYYEADGDVDIPKQ